MVHNNRKIGAGYEQAAGEYLKVKGYQILEYNYRCPLGEVDIIAKDGEYLVFCEVKYRRDTKKGSPFEAVTAAKQKRISRSAEYYIMQKGLPCLPCRFDVIGITASGGSGNKEQVGLIKNAFYYIR